MNKRLFYILYNMAKNNKAAGKMWTFVAKYSYPFFYAVYGFGFLITLFGAKKQLVVYLIIPATVYLLNNTLRKCFNKKRPFQELNIVPLIKHKGSPSFPSNHAACAMVITLVFVNTAVCMQNMLLTALGYIFVSIGILTGLSRIFCGIHYPRDIALGFSVGVLGYFAEYFIINNVLKLFPNF